MIDALNAWWAQQLVLCDWAFTPHPLAVDAGAAEQRLLQLGITNRGELAEQLFHGLGAPAGSADRLLGALEWAALAGAAGAPPNPPHHQRLQRLTCLASGSAPCARREGLGSGGR